jgi:hypothetical protein
MTRRAWMLVITGYAIGALGLLTALFLIERQGDQIESHTDRLDAAAGAFCQALRAEDNASEIAVLRRHANGRVVVVTQTCRRLVLRLEEGD